jgi:hypothetical protein
LNLETGNLYIGFSSPRGIVRLSAPLQKSFDYFRHFKEVEYIKTGKSSAIPIDDLIPFHSLRELRAPLSDLKIDPNTQFLSKFPLFHTLKVLRVWSIPSSFLYCRTFHKLERYKERWEDVECNPEQGPLTDMPVCTRLVVLLSRLATLKLPQISELGVSIDCKNPNHIWERRIAVNANLSGLKVLHLWVDNRGRDLATIDLIEALRSLPALETLVLDGRYLASPYVDFFEAFVPMDVQGIGLNQPSSVSQKSGVLCPRLESLRIEGINLTKEPGPMAVFKDIVTLRAMIGSPLKIFTFYLLGKTWELIGRDGSLVVEKVARAQRFELKI